MTVAELIAKLQTFPPDASIIYACCSEWDEMEAEQVNLHRAEDQTMFLHRGRYFGKGDWVRDKPADLQFVTVVTFPGN